jgi:hypothetical protein
LLSIACYDEYSSITGKRKRSRRGDVASVSFPSVPPSQLLSVLITELSLSLCVGVYRNLLQPLPSAHPWGQSWAETVNSLKSLVLSGDHPDAEAT